MHNAALLDTSFFLRFLNDDSPLFNNADGYFRYFLQKEIKMYIFYNFHCWILCWWWYPGITFKKFTNCTIQYWPCKKNRWICKTGFQNKNKLQLLERNLIPNDYKLFASADIEKNIEFYLLSDAESYKIYRLLKEHLNPKFKFIDLNIPFGETFGVLEL